MLGSDYPFDMCPPDPKQVVLDAGLAAERDRIFGDTPTEVFRLQR